MDLIRPHCFALVAATRRPLQAPITVINTVVPRGARFRLDYILAWYPRTVGEEGEITQTSPDLLFNLLNTRGVAHNDAPLSFVDVTTPAGRNVGGAIGGVGPQVRAAWGWRIEFDPGEIITMEILNMAAGPVPAVVSVTYLGQKGWGRR